MSANKPPIRRSTRAAWLAAATFCGLALPNAPSRAADVWRDRARSPEARAASLVADMTPAEKIQLLSSNMPIMLRPRPAEAVIGAGYVPGIPRLGVPLMLETDASLGVANLMNLRRGDVATALPSGLALAASFDPALDQQAGAMIGSEARAKGFNIMLAGGANLTRDPRGGRTFEYAGEDPLLAGMMAGAEVRGIQSNHIVSTVKHFALNDQESGRDVYDAVIDPPSARESDLLAFEIEIEQGRPNAVMSAYNKVNGAWCSENPWLLTEVLKHDWHFPGWVMSDWGNTHSSAPAANAGLDQQSGALFDGKPFFGALLADAVAHGQVPPARLDDMARRVLRGLIASGAYDAPPKPDAAIDYDAHAAVARRAAERGTVLLRNAANLLPLPQDTASLLVIGGHADVGVLSGGGSTDVRPVGGPVEPDKKIHTFLGTPWYDPSPPLAALRAAFPATQITFDDGTDPARAAALAARAQRVMVVAVQWRSEGFDVPSLSLPDGQDALIAAVAKANPATIVVLETGGAVTMPWLSQVGAVLEAWYPGQKGGEAIADLISGAADPSGHLPISFPAAVEQLPRPVLDGLAAIAARRLYGASGGRTMPSFTVDDRIDGPDVGYRWYARRQTQPLFPFGFGLSYTHFDMTGLRVTGGATLGATLSVRNDGAHAGIAVPQFYATVPSGGANIPHLIGWQAVMLRPGQSQRVHIQADPRLLARFDEAGHVWRVPAGRMGVYAGWDATDARLTGAAALRARALPP